MEYIFDTSKLDDAAEAAGNAASKLDKYYNSLSTKVRNKLQSYQHDSRGQEWTANMQSAYSLVQKKMTAVLTSERNHVQYQKDITALREKAEGVETRIIQKMNASLQTFCNRYGLEFTPSDENVKKNWFVGFIESIVRKVDAWKNYIWKTTKDTLRQWYNYHGGQEILNAVWAVALAIVAVAAMISAVGALLVAGGIWAGIVAFASTISAAIAVLNAVVQVVYAGQAAVSGVNGEMFDAAWNMHQSSNMTFTQQLREWGHYGIANAIDIIDALASVISFASNITKIGSKIKNLTGLKSLMDWKHPFKSLKNDWGAIKNIWGGSWKGFGNMIKQNFKTIYGNSNGKDVLNLFFGANAKTLDYFTKGTKYAKALYDWATYNDATGRNKDAFVERVSTLNPILEAVIDNGIVAGFDISRTETVTTTTRTETITQRTPDATGGTTTTETHTTTNQVSVDNASQKITGTKETLTDTISESNLNGSKTATTTSEYSWKEGAATTENASISEKHSFTSESQVNGGGKVSMSSSNEVTMKSSGNEGKHTTDTYTTAQKNEFKITSETGKTDVKISTDYSKEERQNYKVKDNGKIPDGKAKVTFSEKTIDADGNKHSTWNPNKSRINQPGVMNNGYQSFDTPESKISVSDIRNSSDVDVSTTTKVEYRKSDSFNILKNISVAKGFEEAFKTDNSVSDGVQKALETTSPVGIYEKGKKAWDDIWKKGPSPLPEEGIDVGS